MIESLPFFFFRPAPPPFIHGVQKNPSCASNSAPPAGGFFFFTFTASPLLRILHYRGPSTRVDPPSFKRLRSTPKTKPFWVRPRRMWCWMRREGWQSFCVSWAAPPNTMAAPLYFLESVLSPLPDKSRPPPVFFCTRAFLPPPSPRARRIKKDR